MKYILLYLVLVSCYAKTLSVKVFPEKINTKFSVLVQSAPWCGACAFYKPEIDRVRPFVEPNVTIEIVEDRELPGSPAYVPWTVLAPEDKKCRQEIRGAVVASRLYQKILEVAKCRENP